MNDRVPLHPGRVKLIPVPGEKDTYDLVRADGAVITGTPLTKKNLLSDETATSLGLTKDATVNDALAKLAEKDSELPTPEKIGAATASHTHTAADVGAAAENHTHTAADVGAAAASHTHTAADVGAAPSGHTHTAADVGAAAASHTHTASTITAGTFAATGVKAKSGTDYSTARVRNISAGTNDIGAGASLESGSLYFVYE